MDAHSKATPNDLQAGCYLGAGVSPASALPSSRFECVRAFVQSKVFCSNRLIYIMLQAMEARQTADEQARAASVYNNDRGWNGLDAAICGSIASRSRVYGSLTSPQADLIRKKLCKYNKQLYLIIHEDDELLDAYLGMIEKFSSAKESGAQFDSVRFQTCALTDFIGRLVKQLPGGEKIVGPQLLDLNLGRARSRLGRAPCYRITHVNSIVLPMPGGSIRIHLPIAQRCKSQRHSSVTDR